MEHARAHGVPVPEVFEVSGADIVMERATDRRCWSPRPPAVDAAQARPGCSPGCTAASTGRPRMPGLARRCGDEDPDSQVLLHRDLHPMNVILTPAGPVIIDWEGAASGPALYDVALDLGDHRLLGGAGGSGLEAAVVRGIQAQFTRSFVRAAGPIDQTWRASAVRRPAGRPQTLAELRARGWERLPH